jgi:hypothetical protein
MANNHIFNPSKPFVITALVMLIIGSTLGSIWMMNLYGMAFPAELINIVSLHALIQFDGFITLIIMGIGYLLVPRFRNISVPSVKLAYVSFAFILVSIIFSITVSSASISNEIQTTGTFIANVLRVIGVGVFCIMIVLVLRIRPKLLKMADYFIGLSIILFTTLTVLQSLNYNLTSQNILLWLMFPIMMIFGVEYKTLPSFIGFIWPRKRWAIISAILLTLSIAFGLASSLHFENQHIRILFHFLFLAGTFCFVCALNIFVGFDTSKIMQLSMGEKKARYKYTLVIAKLSFAFLLIGIILTVMSVYFSNIFVLYDMWIHVIAIGFIGLTITLYLPLMLPPILGRTVRFSYFSKFPIWLVIISLGLRGIGDVFIQVAPSSDEVSYQYVVVLLSLSGWMIVAAILSFMIMIHRSMNVTTQVYAEDGTAPL